MTIDKNSAFDCISHEILVEKLRLNKFGKYVIQWITSYLSHRSQYVTIARQKSVIHPTFMGIPQGSVLGPTLFVIYTNKLPEVINKNADCIENVHNEKEKLFNLNCRKCGVTICYADDTSYVTTDISREVNQNNLKNNWKS